MPSLKQPQGWRYLKARLRLLNRPQALGTIAVLLVSGAVLISYWRRQPATPPAPANISASTPALTPAAPLATLGQPSVSQPFSGEPSTPLDNLPVRTEAIALPSSTPAPLDSGLVNSPVLPSPSRSLESAPNSSIDRVPSSLPNLPSLTPASPPAPLADPLRSAIANQTQIAPVATPRSTSQVSPFATSPPPGTTGYILPPTLAPSPSGLPASRPEVTGAVTPPGFPVGSVPQQQVESGQTIGNGQVNSANP